MDTIEGTGVRFKRVQEGQEHHQGQELPRALPPWQLLEEVAPLQGLLFKEGNGLQGKDTSPWDLPIGGTTQRCHPTCQEPGTAGLSHSLAEGRLPPAAG